MLQDRITTQQAHERFVERVIVAGVVWGLKSVDGWAVSPSNEVDDADVMPFWSDRAYAQRAAVGDWSQYEPTSIELNEFIDKWLKGMNEDGVLVGTNWDNHNVGREIDPVALAQELLRALDPGGGAV